jgi:hypothetical protein
MKAWKVICCILSVLVMVGCASQDGRDHMTLETSGYGVDEEAAQEDALERARELMEEKELQDYEIVEQKQLGMEKTDASTTRRDGTKVTVTGVTTTMQYSLLGPEPEPEEEQDGNSPE